MCVGFGKKITNAPYGTQISRVYNSICSTLLINSCTFTLFLENVCSLYILWAISGERVP